MFEELFRTLMPPQQALSPEQIDEARRRAAALPAAPAGDFFQVPANSPDRQAGQLLPLTGGQPTPIQAKGLNFPSVWGAEQASIPRASTEGINPLLLQVAPPSAPTPSSPKDSFVMPQAGAAPKTDMDARQWFDARGGMSPQENRAAVLANNPDMAMRFDNDRPIAPRPPIGTGRSPEEILQNAQLFRDRFRDDNGLNGGNYLVTPAGRADPTGERALAQYLGLAGQDSAQRNKMELLGLENQGRADVAGIQARAAQSSELDKSELHIRDAVGKGLLDKQTGQAMIDTINARRGGIGGGPGGGIPAPGQGGGAGGSTMSPPISAGADVNNLRSLFGQVGPTGQFAANPAAATGQTFSQLIDKIDPSMSPQVVAAIRSGQFGDPTAIKNAAYNALAQNYMMSQGPMPGGQTAAADLVNGGRGGQIPGRYTIPYGPDNKPLLDLIASPPSNVVDSMKKKAGFAQSGVPYDMIRLPDGSQIPFDQSGVQGISNMSSSLGYNQGSRSSAQQRLSKLAQLVEMLQSTQPPPR